MSFNRFLDGFRNTENELSEFIYDKCEKKLIEQEKINIKINTIEKWETRKEKIKKDLLKSIGYLNFTKSPLNPKITGEINKKHYLIKKIVFESHKNVYVTGNLYVPNTINEKVPAILLMCGHCKDSKAEEKYQLAAIELVMNNMVVFCIDPPGQGEMENFINREDVEWGAKEHSYVGLPCTLMGTNIIRYFIWNIIRAVDYLYTLDYINTNKIGICGNSGGGTQSAYAVLLEDRIKAAAIGCYINGRKEYLRTGHAHDSEQNIYNCMGIGFDYSEFITCSVPKPILVLSQQYDFFPVEGVISSVNKAKRIYDLYNKKENIELVIDKNMHGLSDKLRIYLVKWFVKHFTNNKYVSCNPYLYIEKKSILNCTLSGQVLSEYKNAKSINILIYEEYQLVKERTPTLEERIRKVFIIKDEKEQLLERKITQFKFEKFDAIKIFWIIEKKVAIGGIYITGKDNNKCSYLMFNEGTNEIEKQKSKIFKYIEEGDVFIFDTRGIGAFKNSYINASNYYETHGTMYKLVNDSLMAGTSYIEMQINDILQSLKLTNKDIKIVAYGKQVLPCLIANKLSNKIKDIEVINGIKTFNDIMKCNYKAIVEYEVYNMAKYFDIEELMV